MKIGIIRREYITHLDGVNRFCAYLAEGLRKLGHEVFIASWSFYGVEGEDLSKWFAGVHGLDEEILVYTIEEQSRHGDPWAEILFDWWFKGSRLLRELGVDIVVVNGVIPLRFEPKVAVAHGTEALSSLSPLMKMVLKFLYNLYDYVTCVSEATEDMYKNVAKCHEKVPIPLKLNFWKNRPLSGREDIIVHVGTRPIKNPQISFEAIKILRKRGFNVRILFIGPQTDTIESLVQKTAYS